ncbi:MAG: protein kinase [Myxococcales bacterium]|nr:protein kinase [Myxococcales bacterium]
MYIGIYFFGVGDSPRSGWAIYLTGATGYLALNVGAMLGLLPTDQSVMALSTPELPSMFAVTAVCQVLFVATFWMARRSRQATLAAFERLERAARQIRKREALLNEARAELDQERAAKEGRFTDQQVGKYLVGEVIGRGAMGEVYRAWEQGAERAVAIKFLAAAMIEDNAALERFFRESEIATRVRSKHIVDVLDRGVAEGGSPFLVMELLEGADLGPDPPRASPPGHGGGAGARAAGRRGAGRRRRERHRAPRPEAAEPVPHPERRQDPVEGA